MPLNLKTSLNIIPEHSVTVKLRLAVDLRECDGFDVEQVRRFGHALEGDEGARPVQPNAQQGQDHSRLLGIFPGRTSQWWNRRIMAEFCHQISWVQDWRTYLKRLWNEAILVSMIESPTCPPSGPFFALSQSRSLVARSPHGITCARRSRLWRCQSRYPLCKANTMSIKSLIGLHRL